MGLAIQGVKVDAIEIGKEVTEGGGLKITEWL